MSVRAARKISPAMRPRRRGDGQSGAMGDRGLQTATSIVERCTLQTNFGNIDRLQEYCEQDRQRAQAVTAGCRHPGHSRKPITPSWPVPLSGELWGILFMLGLGLRLWIRHAWNIRIKKRKKTTKKIEATKKTLVSSCPRLKRCFRIYPSSLYSKENPEGCCNYSRETYWDKNPMKIILPRSVIVARALVHRPSVPYWKKAIRNGAVKETSRRSNDGSDSKSVTGIHRLASYRTISSYESSRTRSTRRPELTVLYLNGASNFQRIYWKKRQTKKHNTYYKETVTWTITWWELSNYTGSGLSFVAVLSASVFYN